MAVITSRNIPTHLLLAQLSHGSSVSRKLVSHRMVTTPPSLCADSGLIWALQGKHWITSEHKLPFALISSCPCVRPSLVHFLQMLDHTTQPEACWGLLVTLYLWAAEPDKVLDFFALGESCIKCSWVVDRLSMASEWKQNHGEDSWFGSLHESTESPLLKLS